MEHHIAIAFDRSSKPIRIALAETHGLATMTIAEDCELGDPDYAPVMVMMLGTIYSIKNPLSRYSAISLVNCRCDKPAQHIAMLPNTALSREQC